jgi:hypothetical protein
VSRDVIILLACAAFIVGVIVLAAIAVTRQGHPGAHCAGRALNVPARQVAGAAARRAPSPVETETATGAAPGRARPGAVRGGQAPPRPARYGRHDGEIIISERGEIEVRPIAATGRHHASRPRLTEPGTLPRAATPDAPPWDTATTWQPAIDERGPHFFASEIECEDCERESGEPEEPVYPCCEHCHTDGAPCLQLDSHPLPCADGCNAPVYGQAPVADVLEAERLAEAMIP